MKRKSIFSVLIATFLLSILVSVTVVNASGGQTSDPISGIPVTLHPYNLSDHTYTNYHRFTAHKSGQVLFMLNYTPKNNAHILKAELLDSNYNVIQVGAYTSKYVNSGEVYYLKITSAAINYQGFSGQNYVYSAHYTS
ncbi:hypothetical protein I6N90_01310 [Paenibacillus sp. GSMTC-2017]|uniref:hypothetical protein n=1 Tax=Paenibacillus sp. GSMTC-2017 TaxID=2794350 RepID=UPI0018DA0E7D|nr:hypothetical protein [Paenibacillus sp. GSMTC-2017]MBH5316442.1 hypothetical protein [Paenibacillus sp. GSMTC-2017]